MTKTSTASALPGAPAFPPDLEAKIREALRAMGPESEPRTHPIVDGTPPRFTNRLILESSPYLLQHAHNPVNWYPWGDEAFEAARALRRPILLSVGYSTCHWCHVMESESFEDEEIAAYINANFIPIKVDREERPDVDSVYMTAVQMMSGGHGGWPMTVVMTPDHRPFFGGTYFPPRDGARGARVGFLTILKRLTELYQNEPQRILDSANQIADLLRHQAERLTPQGIPRDEALHTAAQALAARFDPRFGGFGSAPKFPRPSTYELLLRYWRRTGDETALNIATRSLTHMATGGIYDQVGGGFHRYSTDERWLVPHFEKMLYDNAQLVCLLVEAHQATGDALFARIARETLDYVLREMTSPEGGFCSATDADSEGEEGRFFVWTVDELGAALGEARARTAAAFFGANRYGNFEGKNILHRERPAHDVAEELGIDEASLETEVAEIRRLLYSAREKRSHPLRDDKILTEWNGQMISAFARAGFAFDERRYLDAASRAAEFVLTHLRRGGRLLRSFRGGQAKHAAMLEDHAFLIAGLLDLFEATSDERWIAEATSIEALLERHHLDRDRGAFFATPDDGESLLIREKPTYDGAQPSGNSVAAINLLRLAELTTSESYRTTAEQLLAALAEKLEKGALECPKLAAALDFFLDRPKQIIIVTSTRDNGSKLIDVVRRTFLPNKVFVVTPEGEQAQMLARRIPLLEDKRALGGSATAYVCTARVCRAPTSSPIELAKQLAEVEMLALQKKLSVPR